MAEGSFMVVPNMVTSSEDRCFPVKMGQSIEHRACQAARGSLTEKRSGEEQYEEEEEEEGEKKEGWRPKPDEIAKR
ncbi:hypothetical protein CRG98_014432 [Punica granatum]|uniref:Uncharacterized protein n=1 Tax=Punica granatum TaxID=22663 RepID=A0A2I0K985_PUNGR|nr:hypothetical protein CRG98_014432 [Punica granatum]